MSAVETESSANPLLQPSTLPFELPAVRRHHARALPRGDARRHGRAAGRGARRSPASPEPPTFENTVVALERVRGSCSSRAAAVFGNLAVVAGHAAAAGDRARDRPAGGRARRRASGWTRRCSPAIDAVHAGRARGRARRRAAAPGRALPPRLRAGRRPARRGRPGPAHRAQPGAVRRSRPRFGQNLQAATEAAAVARRRRRRARRADRRGDRGRRGRRRRARARPGYLITLVLPTGQPLLARLRNRDAAPSAVRGLGRPGVRRRARQRPGGHRDRPLRAERARLLGFATHADAGGRRPDRRHAPRPSTDARPAWSARRWPTPTPRPTVLAEVAARDGVELAAWDWAFYSEQVRARAVRRRHRGAAALFRAGPGAASTASSPRRSGSTASASRRAPDLVGYHPDVRVWEVARRRRRAGRPLPRRLLRPRGQARRRLDELLRRPVAAARHPAGGGQQPQRARAPAAGQPALLTLDEVNTLFHEFGHALHGLFSPVTYPRFSGTSVPRDFVEFPSQVNEMWALWPEVLANYARHVETGEPLPPAVVEAIDAAAAVGRGLRAPLEYLAATLLDQAWHRIRPDDGDRRPGRVRAAGAGATPASASDLVPPRYRTHLLPAHLRRRLLGRLLLLHLVGGARRRHRRVVQARTAGCAGRTATPSAPGCSRSAARSTRWRPSAPSAAATPTRAAAPPPRPAHRELTPESAARDASSGATSPLRSEPGELRGPGRGRRGPSPSRTSRLGWRCPHAVQRCTTCQPLPDFSTSPTGSIGARHSLPGRPAGRRRAATTGRTGSGCGSARRCWPARGASSARRRSRCSPPAGSGRAATHRTRSGDERLDADDLDGDVLAVGGLVGHRRARLRAHDRRAERGLGGVDREAGRAGDLAGAEQELLGLVVARRSGR